MLATYWNAMRETFSRRVALVLLGVAAVVSVAFNWLVGIQTAANGTHAMVVGTQPPAPAAIAVPAVLESELHTTGTLWLLLATFAAAPLLAGTLEKGWFELLFSKGTARWRIFCGRFLAGLTLYALTFAIAAFPLALRLWWRTGIATWEVGTALLIQTFSFAALLAVTALVTLPQKGVALPIIATAGIWVLSPLLANRQEAFYRILSSHVAREVVDWIYRILPKCTELENLCAALIQGGAVGSWWPIWSTGVFTLCVFGMTLWLLERKSF